jgi:hypothetical protein
MPAARLDLTAKQGRTFRLSLVVSDEDGNPIDLTGCSAAMQVRASYGATDTLLDWASGTEITLGGTAGTVEIEAEIGDITVPDTGGVPPILQAVYDLKLVYADETTDDPLEGLFTIEREVTA